jgi:hypothetical protein
MVRSGLDSIYCMFLFGGGPFEGQAFILKVNQPISSGNLRPFLNGGYRDFDCWASSTGGFYVFADSLSNAYLPRYASSNGGVTWNQRGLVTSSAANPFCVKSGSGDTAILMYYQTTTGLMDTTTAGITIARYREASLGSLTSIAFLTSIIPAGPQKDQFGAAWYSGTAWALYTTGAPGSRDIMCIVSTNDGVSYGSAIPVANSSSVDEYYFDITHYTLGTGGADIIYYYDSTGGPSNSTDKMMYTFSNVTAPSTFNPAEQFSEHYPQPSTRRYIPFLTEYYDGGGDVGAFWVGVDGSNRKVYFDRLLAITGIKKEPVSLPVKYSLRQNYPNPFNPVTKINFSIPKNEYVTLKVYDILGREVATIVDKEMTAGVYTVEIDGTRLSSGVYFYRLTSGNFIDTKKMVLLK